MKTCRALLGIAFVALALLPAAAYADSLQYQLFPKVPLGERPRVRIIAGEAANGIVLDLNRSDGKRFNFKVGDLAAGASRDVQLSGDAGQFGWAGRLRAFSRGQQYDLELDFQTVVAPPLQVQLDKSKVDLKQNQLELRLSRDAGKVEVKVIGDSGYPVAEEEHDFAGKSAGSPLLVTWKPKNKEPIVKIVLKVGDAWGFYAGLTVTPWSVSIPHEEVSFETNSADIQDGERAKLEKSLQLINEAVNKYGRMELGDIKLFIAGHSDTVGDAAYNLKLSQLRAQSISLWFRKRGLRIPIAFEGFGEHALLVRTADNVDEPRNRRVDYILSVEEPVLKATNYKAGWRRIK